MLDSNILKKMWMVLITMFFWTFSSTGDGMEGSRVLTAHSNAVFAFWAILSRILFLFSEEGKTNYVKCNSFISAER